MTVRATAPGRSPTRARATALAASAASAWLRPHIRLRHRRPTTSTNSSSSTALARSASASTSSASAKPPSSWRPSPKRRPASAPAPAAVQPRRTREPFDLLEVVPRPRQPGRRDEPVGVGDAGGLEPGRGHDEHVLTPTAPAALDALDPVEQEATAPQRRHLSPEDLAVERMGQVHELAAPIGAKRDGAGVIERLEHLVADDAFQFRRARSFPHGEDLDRLSLGRTELDQPDLDELGQPGRRRQRAGEPPRPSLAHEATVLEG